MGLLGNKRSEVNESSFLVFLSLPSVIGVVLKNKVSCRFSRGGLIVLASLISQIGFELII